jgi:hypothetical protein
LFERLSTFKYLILGTEILGPGARWTLQREYAGHAIRINALPSTPEYTRSDWWTVERGIVEFQNGILK